jgi:hypothetical protein
MNTFKKSEGGIEELRNSKKKGLRRNEMKKKVGFCLFFGLERHYLKNVVIIKQKENNDFF